MSTAHLFESESHTENTYTLQTRSQTVKISFKDLAKLLQDNPEASNHWSITSKRSAADYDRMADQARNNEVATPSGIVDQAVPLSQTQFPKMLVNALNIQDSLNKFASVLGEKGYELLKIPTGEQHDGQQEGSVLTAINGRAIVMVKMGNAAVPFYCSSGQSHKDKLANQTTDWKGSWWPFMGIGFEKDPSGAINEKQDWFNKSNDMYLCYNHPKFQEIATLLNEHLGDIRLLGHTLPEPPRAQIEPVFNFINQSMPEKVLSREDKLRYPPHQQERMIQQNADGLNELIQTTPKTIAERFLGVCRKEDITLQKIQAYQARLTTQAGGYSVTPSTPDAPKR